MTGEEFLARCDRCGEVKTCRESELIGLVYCRNCFEEAENELAVDIQHDIDEGEIDPRNILGW